MINYDTSLWGFRILLRLHGSALYKAATPATVSTAILLGIYYGKNLNLEDRLDYRVFDHPYALGVFMVAYTFTLTFKLSFAYNRYWEACTAVHQMHSKWLDVGMEMAAFHMQSNRYKDIQPPAFGAHPDINSVRRARDRVDKMNPHDVEQNLESLVKPNLIQRMFKRRKKQVLRMGKNINRPANAGVLTHSESSHGLKQRPKAQRLQSVAVLDGGIKSREPALFLQELAHLLSLISAVAFSTLRNDCELAESPLAEFEPGAPWQPVDPDDMNAFSNYVRKEYYRSRSKFQITCTYILGFNRSDKSKALYNLARPFRVIGGVSDGEIKLLQSARGPLAKVALCSMWLQEFISREYMNGSTGGVAPPIISRLFQYTSDGMVGYNQARKVAYIPFPFVHNQVTAFFTLFAIVYLPVLFLTYLKDFWAVVVMNLFTIWCFCALYEVARELEMPFQNAPNDLPLNNFQHQFNEALITMYDGFHPDAWWEIEGKVKTPESVHRLPSFGENEKPKLKSVNFAEDFNAEAKRGNESGNVQQEESKKEKSVNFTEDFNLDSKGRSGLGTVREEEERKEEVV